MKLSTLNLHPYRLPLVAAFQVKGRETAVREGVLVEAVADDGATGWGDIAPLPGFSGESLRDAIDAVAENRVLLLADPWPESLDGELPSALNALPPSARFGVESAWLQALAARRSTSVASLVDPSPGSSVVVNALLAGDREELVARAAEVKAAGYRCAKIKVGRRTPAEDAAIVVEVARVLGPDVAIRVDANRSWDLEQAKTFGVALAGTPLEYVEEPLKNPMLYPRLAGTVPYAVALDETLLDTPVPVWETWQGVGAVVLKPTMLGSLVRTVRIARRAVSRGLRAVISSSFESGVGLGMLVELASAIGGGQTPAGLDTYRWLAADVVSARLPLGGASVDVGAVRAAAGAVDRSRVGRRP